MKKSPGGSFDIQAKCSAAVNAAFQGEARMPGTCPVVGLCYCHRMKRPVDVILGLTAAVATALLLGIVARDDVGMSADMIRTDALSAAGIIFAAVAGGSLLKREK